MSDDVVEPFSAARRQQIQRTLGSDEPLRIQDGVWRVIRLPELAEANDPLGRALDAALRPEWEDEVAIELKRHVLGERDFQSLFQQSPRPPGGGLFYTQKSRIIDAAPAGWTHTVRAWDLSATGGGDWSVGVKLARYPSGTFVRFRPDRATR